MISKWKFTAMIDSGLEKKLLARFEGQNFLEERQPKHLLALNHNMLFWRFWDPLLLIYFMFILLDRVLALRHPDLRPGAFFINILPIPFYIDLGLRFFRANRPHSPDYQYVRDVSAEYAKGYFVLDLICCFRLFHIHPLLFYLQLWRLRFALAGIRSLADTFARIHLRIHRNDIRYSLSSQVVESLFVVLLFTMMIFHFVTLLLSLAKFDPPEASIPKLYLSSFYFSITTLTTVGYGDLTPPAFIASRLVTILMQFFGIVLYGFVSEQVRFMMERSRATKAAQIQRKKDLDEWLSDVEGGYADSRIQKIQKKITRAMEFYWEWDLEGVFGADFYKALPPDDAEYLSESPISYILETFASFFKNMDHETGKLLVKNMKPRM